MWLASASAKDIARCILCSKEFNIGKGGMSNLVSHSKSKKHIEFQNSACSDSNFVSRNQEKLSMKMLVTFNSSRNQMSFKSYIFTIYVQVMSGFQRVISVNV